MKEKALIYLSRDFLLHIDMIEGIRRNTADILYAEDDGVLIKYRCCGFLALSAVSEERALEMIGGCGVPFDGVIVHQEELIEPVASAFGMHEVMERFYNCVFIEPVPEPMGDIRPIPPELAETVDENYEHADLEYIQNRIETGNIFGIFVEGRLAGFVGEHEEGAMGMLMVLPEFRKRGLGTELDRFNILRERAMGHIPYGQIVKSNSLSIKMHGDMGAVLSGSLLGMLEKD